MTAFTLTETLSLVITSCGGTSMATVRKLTRTSLSTNGMITTMPGPFPPTSPRATPKSKDHGALIFAQHIETHENKHHCENQNAELNHDQIHTQASVCLEERFHRQP